MDDIVNASSDTVIRYCNRDFALTTYDEVLDGSGARNLLLSQYPVTQILRIATNNTNAMGIHQSDTGCSRASWRLDGTTASPSVPNYLYLVSAKNGVETAVTIGPVTSATPTVTINGGSPTTIAQMLTLTDLATAINTYVGSYGWQSIALGQFGTWPIADLRPPQGALEARWYGYAFLTMFGLNFFLFDFNPDVGEIVSAQGFDFGYRNYRVIYQAGYSTVPSPIQQAVAALAVSVYQSRGINTNLQSESLGGYSYSLIADKTFHQLDLVSRYGLNLWKSHRIGKFKVTV
jgi:hypothetical protein